MTKILEKNGVENTGIDTARFNRFCASYKDGILKRSFNECKTSLLASNVLQIDSGELLISGFRVVVSATQFTFNVFPTNVTRHQIVAQIIFKDGNLDFSYITRAICSLRQDDILSNKDGIYEIEIARFSLESNKITDLVRTADIITGEIGDLTGGEINIGNITTNTLEEGMEAEVDIEQRYDEQDKKTYTDFSFSIPKGDTGATGTPAGFGTPTATIDDNVGTPSVTVTATGEDTSKVFNFAFKNLKGEKGDKGDSGDSGEIYQTIGESTTGSMSQKAVTEEFSKYIAKESIADNLETKDSTKVLSATQGKVLNDNFSELKSDVNKKVESAKSASNYSTYINNDGSSISLILEQGQSRVAEILIAPDGISINTTQSIKLNGGTISYDSETDTFTI